MSYVRARITHAREAHEYKRSSILLELWNAGMINGTWQTSRRSRILLVRIRPYLQLQLRPL